MPQPVSAQQPAIATSRPVYGPVDPAAQPAVPVRNYAQDEFRLSPNAAEARDRWRDSNDRAREMVQTDQFDSRPRAYGPFARHRNVNPLSGIRRGTDLGDGWRLEGAVSPRRGGQVGVGIRRTF